MRKISQKLNNSRGATIIIALLGFLVATMVSVVIVTAAVASDRSVADDRESTRNRLNIESAAQLVEKELETASYTITYRNCSASYPGYGAGFPAYAVDSGSDSFDTLVMNAAKAVDGAASGTEKGSFTISVENDAGIDAEDVKVEYSMQTDDTDTGLGKYDIKCTLTGQDSGTVIYLYMQRYEPTGKMVSERWDYVDSGEQDDDGNEIYNYVWFYTDTTYTYGWKLISIQSVDITSAS